MQDAGGGLERVRVGRGGDDGVVRLDVLPPRELDRRRRALQQLVHCADATHARGGQQLPSSALSRQSHILNPPCPAPLPASTAHPSGACQPHPGSYPIAGWQGTEHMPPTEAAGPMLVTKEARRCLLCASGLHALRPEAAMQPELVSDT